MQREQVETAIGAAPKGANIVVEWVRPCKTRKGVQDSITKAVRMVGRMGIDYDNIGAVQDKRESGELPKENAGLPWGVWATFPYLIEHQGAFYLRLYNGTSEKVKPEVHFFRNGVEVRKDEIAPVLLASEKEEKHGDCFTCKLENMTRIHTEAEWLMVEVVGQVGQEKLVSETAVPAKTIAALQVK